jgi:hypothetical protein
VNSRNLSSHTYSQELAEQIALKIKQEYIFAFIELAEYMKIRVFNGI